MDSKSPFSSKIDLSSTSVIPQQKIGLCINFNYNPDAQANTLRSLLMYYTLMHRYIIIITPSSLSSLSEANQALLYQYNVVTLTSTQVERNQHVRLNLTEKIHGSLFHVSCTGTNRGIYQQVCISLCAQFFDQQHIPSMQGILYIPDDIFLNFTMILMNSVYYNFNEFWISPATGLVDATLGKQQPSRWYWWHVNDNWNRLHQTFFVEKLYSDFLSIIYGPNRLFVSALADILYIPVADNQLKTFINITDIMMTRFPHAFCEIILPIIVDVASSISGHWPYQHDRILFHSTINRLNNLTNLKKLEKNSKITNAFKYVNINRYQQRPCLFNVNGSLWGAHRHSEMTYRRMLFTGRSPFFNDTINNRIDYIHPMKLSSNSTWQYQLWHQAMRIQIQRLHDLQFECL